MKPRLTLVVAVSENGVIGRDGGLPWRLPEDLKHFRRLTLGNTVLMGRKTFESLGKPLEGRANWVLTRDAAFAAAGARVFRDLDAALAASPQGELLVIGGAELYRQTLPLASRLELTRVHAQVEGDTRFPDYDAKQWRETSRVDHAADERHAHAYSFLTLDRI
ncbi:dihydrofolate reductase [Nevskia soli]|uniref:dihydrofolate reductase n=1 Tax=Nevskia soli TaxID=418856 RepID=UPI0004A6FDEF|nr:dihydrofolate reductase [Nevskia soli]